MASTRDLVVYILNHSPKIRKWCEDKHNFTLSKAEASDLSQYGDFTAEIIQDGIKEGVISKAQAEGQAPL